MAGVQQSPNTDPKKALTESALATLFDQIPDDFVKAMGYRDISGAPIPSERFKLLERIEAGLSSMFGDEQRFKFDALLSERNEATQHFLKKTSFEIVKWIEQQGALRYSSAERREKTCEEHYDEFLKRPGIRAAVEQVIGHCYPVHFGYPGDIVLSQVVASIATLKLNQQRTNVDEFKAYMHWDRKE